MFDGLLLFGESIVRFGTPETIAYALLASLVGVVMGARALSMPRPVMMVTRVAAGWRGTRGIFGHSRQLRSRWAALEGYVPRQGQPSTGRARSGRLERSKAETCAAEP